MIGIYKITNMINNHCYIGQSVNITKRWKNEKCAAFNPNDKSYDYPLSKAFRKYGVDNFSFEIIEECSLNELDEKENYWIKYYNSEYNQTNGGGNYQINSSKLTLEQVNEIKFELMNNPDVVHKDLAEKYNVHRDTIRDINMGYSWVDENLSYPLHKSKFRQEKKIWRCKRCNKQISVGSEHCRECQAFLVKQRNIDNLPVSREELKEMIRTLSFSEIGRRYGYSDNAIRKWCDKLNLPRTKKEIKTYSDEEWFLI